MASQFVDLPLEGTGGGGGGAVNSFNGRIGTVVSQAGDYSGSLISNTPAGSITSTNVQSAINELDTDVQANTASISSINSQLPNKQPLDSDLTAIAALSSTGLIARTGSGTAATRTVTAGSNIAVTNGDGVSGNPTIALSGVIPIANGGTDLSTAPANGQLLIGNGVNYTLAQLLAGSGISIVNGAGTITLTNTNATNQNIDGGQANSVYGGTEPINGGNA